MYGYTGKFTLIILVSGLLVCGVVSEGKTWHLEKGGWTELSETQQGRYLLAVSELKKLVNEGKSKEIASAVAKLKRDFPDIAGPDLDLFVKADKFFAQGKFTKAVRTYDTLLAKFPDSALYDAALEREFEIGQAYLQGHKKRVLKVFKLRGYTEGEKIMDRIIDRAGASPIAIKAALAVADSYEKRGKYDEAYEQWSEIGSRWPTGQVGKDAALAMARCKHAAYRGPKYDASYLVSARTYYENFKKRYPEDAERFEIDKRLEQIREQLAYKEYLIAEYYQRTGSTQSANLYCEMVLDEWPDSTAAKRAKNLMDKTMETDKEKK